MINPCRFELKVATYYSDARQTGYTEQFHRT